MVMGFQGWALAVKMSRLGSYQLGSSRLPAQRTVRCAATVFTRNTGELQSGQKARRISWPLSALLTKHLASALVTVKSSVFTPTAARRLLAIPAMAIAHLAHPALNLISHAAA